MASTKPEKCQEVLDYVLMYPERHNQSDWATLLGDKPNLCDTAVCACGTAAMLDGRLEFKQWYNAGVGRDVWVVEPNMYVNKVDESEGVYNDWEDLGEALLGLNKAEACVLFGATNELAVVLLKHLANGEDILDDPHIPQISAAIRHEVYGW